MRDPVTRRGQGNGTDRLLTSGEVAHFPERFVMLLGVQLRRPLVWCVMGSLGIMPLVFTLALEVTGANRPEQVQSQVMVPSSSGFVVWVLALASTMKFFLPLAISVFAANAIAGERSSGSLRYVMSGPQRRSSVMWDRLVVAAALSVGACAALALGGLVAGLAAFGWHPLAVSSAHGGAFGTPLGVYGGPSATTSLLGPWVALWRLVWSTAYVGVGETAVFAMAFFLSVVSARPFVAVTGGVALAVVSWSLQTDLVPGLRGVAAFTPTHGIGKWQFLLLAHPPTGGMVEFLVKQGLYASMFLGLAWMWFVRRDVLG
ncbi:MAG: ABC transporter permease [Acidimicrobiales bacterium]